MPARMGKTSRRDNWPASTPPDDDHRVKDQDRHAGIDDRLQQDFPQRQGTWRPVRESQDMCVQIFRRNAKFGLVLAGGTRISSVVAKLAAV